MSTIFQTPPSNIYITGELAQRALKPADSARENRALQQLATRMLDHPEEVLPRFVELAMEITGGSSAGVSLYEENPAPGIFRWRYLHGKLAPFENATTPRNFSPCGITLDENRPVLSRHPEVFYDWISDAKIVVPEVLLVPLYLGGTEPLGTLWIVSDREGHFDAADARLAGELATFVGTALRMLNTQKALKQALEEQEMLAKEMSHRVKNLFAVAEGMVRLGARSDETKEEMVKTLIGRFHALANAHGLVRRSFHTGPDASRLLDLAVLMETIVRPHERLAPGAPSRFSISGPAIACGEHALNGVALVFHEFATNAAKYGALQSDGGQIDVRWAVEGEELVFHWSEQGGPAIAAAPQTMGFGGKLLNDTITRQFGGSFAHAWEPQGLKAVVRLPMKSLAH
jgi:two-component sensor histidine kinase